MESYCNASAGTSQRFSEDTRLHPDTNSLGDCQPRSLLRAAATILSISVLVAACSSTDANRVDEATPPPNAETTLGSGVRPNPTPVVTPTIPPASPRPDAPNVIVFMTDDQSIEQMAALPRTQELLAGRGVTFSNSFVNYPTCCPSRATFLTGQHATNHGVLWNRPPDGGFEKFAGQDTTLPVALQANGYDTYFVGKYLNGYGITPEFRTIPKGWSNFHGLVEPTATMYFGYSMFHDGQMTDYTMRDEDYITDVTTDIALANLRKQAETGGPLFMWVSYVAPHSAGGVGRVEFEANAGALRAELDEGPKPAIPAPRHVGLAKDVSLPVFPSYNEEDIEDKPAPLQRPPMDGATEEGVLTAYRQEIESLMSVDESIQAIVQELEAQGRLDNTYLIFTSDNGQMHGQHRFASGKYLVYEPSIRVPLIIAGPGVRAGEASSLVSNVDLAPTIADLTSTELLREPDGKSLVPLLRDGGAAWDRALFIETRGPIFPLRPQYRAVRAKDWLYAEYSSGDRELYDLVADPDQLVNVVSDPSYAATVVQLSGWLRILESCKGPTCAEVGSLDAPVGRESG